jgi:hypothetical protein
MPHRSIQEQAGTSLAEIKQPTSPLAVRCPVNVSRSAQMNKESNSEDSKYGRRLKGLKKSLEALKTGSLTVNCCNDKGEFKKQIDEWIRLFRKIKPAPGTNGPLIPVDPKREAEAI